MVTGEAFRNFSSDPARAFLVSLVNDDIEEGFNQIMLGLSAVVKIINSQKRKVNTQKLFRLSQEVYLLIVEIFPWAKLSQ